jgi:hypothetical protein
MKQLFRRYCVAKHVRYNSETLLLGFPLSLILLGRLAKIQKNHQLCRPFVGCIAFRANRNVPFVVDNPARLKRNGQSRYHRRQWWLRARG